jgi:hypothetical protein
MKVILEAQDRCTWKTDELTVSSDLMSGFDSRLTECGQRFSCVN